MKKLILTILIILIFGESYALFHFFKSNKIINIEINNISTKINTINNDNKNIENEKQLLLGELENEKINNDKYIKEYEIWNNMNEKIKSYL